MPAWKKALALALGVGIAGTTAVAQRPPRPIGGGGNQVSCPDNGGFAGLEKYNDKGPMAAPVRGAIGCVDNPKQVTNGAGQTSIGSLIYGPMEAGFSNEQLVRFFKCQNPNAAIVGGLDTLTAQHIVEYDCGMEAGTADILDSCGGHAMPYHYHERMTCLYESSENGHSTRIGTALDGRGIYGRYIEGGVVPKDLDACGGRFGVTPDSDGKEVYYYVVQDRAPFTVGCFGPVRSVEECRSLYSTCGDGDEMSITTADGTFNYDPDCPCYDSNGSNVVGTVPTKPPTEESTKPTRSPSKEGTKPTRSPSKEGTKPTRSPSKEGTKPCICTKELNQVCADGRTFGNPCMAKCAGAVKYEMGACRGHEDNDCGVERTDCGKGGYCVYSHHCECSEGFEIKKDTGSCMKSKATSRPSPFRKTKSPSKKNKGKEKEENDSFLFGLNLAEELEEGGKCHKAIVAKVQKLRKYFAENGSPSMDEDDKHKHDGNRTRPEGDKHKHDGNRTRPEGDKHKHRGNHTRPEGDKHKHRGNHTRPEGDKHKHRGNHTRPEGEHKNKDGKKDMEHGKGAKDAWFKENGGNARDLVSLFCQEGYECVAEYLSHAIKHLHAKNKSEAATKLRLEAKDLRAAFEEKCKGKDDGKKEKKAPKDKKTKVDFPKHGEVDTKDLPEDQLEKILKDLDTKDIESHGKRLFGKEAPSWNRKQKEDIVRNLSKDKKIKHCKNWTKKDVDDLEGIIEGVDAEELSEIPERVFEEKLNTFAAKNRTFDKLQLRELAKKAKQAMKKNLTNWKKEDCKKMNGLLKGLLADELEEITRETIVEAIDTFGNLTNWERAKLKNLIKKLIQRKNETRKRKLSEDLFGEDLNLWSENAVKKCGTVINGMTSEEFSQLSQVALLGLSPEALSEMPEDIADALASQISQMQVSDAGLFTDEQKSAMPEAAASALDELLSSDEDDSSNLPLIIGGAAGGVVVLAAAAIAMKKRRRAPASSNKLPHSAHGIAYGHEDKEIPTAPGQTMRV